MSNISLTASMRSNLLSLQNTQSLMDTTQERLSTGKKVNSAIDNPSSYYTAQSLNNRASDLSSLLDSMGQAIQTIKAADEGIEAITTFAQQAKAIAQSAADSNDATERANYMEQFNKIMTQIDELANDSGYKGVNLLKDGNLTVKFSENGSSLSIEGEDATSTGLGMAAGADWGKVADATTTALGELNTAKESVKDAEDAVKEAQTAYDTATADQKEAKLTALNTAKGDLEDAQSDLKDKQTAYDEKVAADIVAGNGKISESMTKVETAISTLRGWSSKFGNNYSIVQNREEFTENLINVLTEGADKLTLADMNEESANMLALQTRQQLAINSLSLASQAAQSVLKLF